MGKLTPVFVGAIFIIFLFFLVTYLRRAWTALQALKLERELINEIRGKTNDAKNYLDEFRKLSSDDCREFSKIIITDNYNYYATQDIESKVEDIWLPDILQSRMFPTVSTILTGLGVLGTFIGLLIGLNGLTLKGDMDQLQGEIQRMANGAAIAFVTSICGVFLSLFFTTVEKWFSDKIIVELKGLQRDIVQLFHPVPIMQVFVDIKKANEESRQTLNGLAEQIGEKMQETLTNSIGQLILELKQTIEGAIDTIAEVIGTNINNTLGESIRNLENSIQKMIEIFEKMSDDQVKTVTDNLKGKIQDFIDTLTRVGNGPTTTLQTAADDMGVKIGELTGVIASMGDFIRKFDEYKENTDKLHGFITNDFVKLIDSIKDASESLTTSSNNLKQFGTEIPKSTQAVKEAADAVKDVSEKQDTAITNLNTVTDTLNNISEDFKNISNSLAGSVNTAQDAFNELSEHYNTLHDKLVDHMEKLGEQNRNRIKQLDEHMQKLLEHFVERVKAIITDFMNNWEKQTEPVFDHITEVITELSGFIEEIGDNKQSIK